MFDKETPLITRLNHIAMRTANTTVMRNFYSKVLGLDVKVNLFSQCASPGA